MFLLQPDPDQPLGVSEKSWLTGEQQHDSYEIDLGTFRDAQKEV